MRLSLEETGNVSSTNLPSTIRRLRSDAIDERPTLCRNTAFLSSSSFFSSLYRAHSRSLISCTEYDDDERTQVVGTDRVYVARIQYARSLFQATPAKPERHLTGNLISVDIRGLFSIDCAQHNNKDQRHRGGGS